MADFQVEFSADDRAAIAHLRRMGVRVMEVLRPAFHRSGLGNEAAIEPYPPPPPGSRYVRTGRLGRSWTTETTVSGESIVTSTGNVTRYGPWVQQAGTQARVHQGRWPTDELVLVQRRGAIEAEISGALRGGL